MQNFSTNTDAALGTNQLIRAKLRSVCVFCLTLSNEDEVEKATIYALKYLLDRQDFLLCILQGPTLGKLFLGKSNDTDSDDEVYEIGFTI